MHLVQAKNTSNFLQTLLENYCFLGAVGMFLHDRVGIAPPTYRLRVLNARKNRHKSETESLIIWTKSVPKKGKTYIHAISGYLD